MAELTLHRETTALLIVDVQERLASAMVDDARERCVANVARLVRGAGLLHVPIVVTEQYPKGLGRTVAPVLEALAEAPATPDIVEKIEFDACRNPGFGEVLRAGVAGRTLVLCGMEAHICVWQTARGLVSQGFSVHIPIDATCSRDPDNRRIAEGLWRQAGAVVTCTETVLFDLVGSATGDVFKAISHMVR